MLSWVESLIEGVVRIAVDAFAISVANTCLKDQNKLTKIAGTVGGFIVGEMVADKASEWTKEQVQETIAEFKKAASLLEDEGDEKSGDGYTVR